MDVVIVVEDPDGDPVTRPVVPGPYDRLPPPVRLEDTIATQDVGSHPEQNVGRDPERDFMLRYAAG